ncbi:class I fructose-bisphosphate aldolase [Microbulbifer sp. GL-2]|uniref:class I fructose-bisphosphate aldolase n=1 Tax=Microbulbifer sp. GL-2 TaxID=2591606 RepID=UPI0011628BA7|nr:class I fructose-bisphosphate aldolase [Microbulbifer sp. GL-2]BBM02495.1 fructose-bisphosphate aldolase [Microbulbifer sp. GL-2]
MEVRDELQATVEGLVDGRRGILAADESSGTIAKRFNSIGVESTEENRRNYRAALLGAEGLGQYVSGVILFEETLGQCCDRGAPLAQVAVAQNIVPGIKVDKGKGPLPGATGDMITYGLDGLAERLRNYKEQGARFAKWREVYPVSPHNPTDLGLRANAEMLARYAAVCQAEGVVPIVEPEVLMDGSHGIERCAEVNEQVWHTVFHALYRHGVTLELMLLKPSMVTPGAELARVEPQQVAEQTLRRLRRAVPAAVPSINFLSGGQGNDEASENLNALNQLNDAPWQLSFSYGRALQQPALAAWAGQSENTVAAQRALVHRARMNHLAMLGQYRSGLEQES